MKPNFKEIYEDYLDLKETIRSQGYTVEVEEKLTKFDKQLESFQKELISKCVVVRGKPQLETTITIKKILGVDSDKKE